MIKQPTSHLWLNFIQTKTPSLIRQERNGRAFSDIELSNQAIKSLFLYNFVNWVSAYIEDHALSMISFIDWLFVK